MNRVMVNANETRNYTLESFKRTHPEKYKLYEKRQSEEPFFGLGDVGQSDPFGDLSDLTYPKDKADLLKFPKKETKLSKDYDDALFNQKATNELQKNLNKETKDLEKINEIEELSKDLSKESDVDKILLKSEELKKSKKKTKGFIKQGDEITSENFGSSQFAPTKVVVKPPKPGQGKFTKAEYLIQRLKNTIKQNPKDKYVQDTFPGFIKELKENPDLAKDENVFKELGGDLPEDQQIVVYDDDTLDFFTQKEGPGNIALIEKFMEENPFLSREEAIRVKGMEPNDQVLELTKLKFLNKKKTDNAEGGIINLAEGGRINFRGGGMDMGNASNQAQSAASSGHGSRSGGGGGNARENYRTKQYTTPKTKTTTSGGGGSTTTPKTKPKTKTVTTGGKSPFAYTKPPKTNTTKYGIDKSILATLINQSKINQNKGLFSGNVKMTYHGSPFSKNIVKEGFKPGSKFSIAPGKVFSTTNPKFASTYGKPISMLTPKSAFSIPSINLNTGSIGKEVIQNPSAATKGMNIASKIGTKFTGPTAQKLASGATLGKVATGILGRANLPISVGTTAFEVAYNNPTIQKYGTKLGESIYNKFNPTLAEGGIISLRKRR